MEFVAPAPIDMNEVKRDIDRALLIQLAKVEADFALSTGTWESDTQPDWKQEGPKTEGGHRVIYFQTESTPFTYVDQGTDGPYPIPKTPKVQGFLAFKTGGFPKTKPGRLVAGPGAPGNKWASAKQVMHPGIEERDISGQVAKKSDQDFHTTVQSVINKGRTY